MDKGSPGIFANQPELIDPVVPGRKYMQSYETFMLNRFELMGAAGQSRALQPLIQEIQHTIIGQE